MGEKEDKLMREVGAELEEDLNKYHPEITELKNALALFGDTKTIKEYGNSVNDPQMIMYANQIDIGRLYAVARTSLELGPDLPFGGVRDKFNEATSLFERISKEDGFNKGVTERYLEIASLVPKSFKKGENYFADEIEKRAKKDKISEVKRLREGFEAYANHYVALIHKYSKQNTNFWMKKMDETSDSVCNKFISTLNDARVKLEGNINKNISRKRVRVAARRAYFNVIGSILGDMQKYYGDKMKDGSKATMEKTLYTLAKEFDEVPRTIQESKEAKMFPIIKKHIGEVKCHDNDPDIYNETNIAMDQLTPLLQYGSSSR